MKKRKARKPGFVVLGTPSSGHRRAFALAPAKVRMRELDAVPQGPRVAPASGAQTADIQELPRCAVRLRAIQAEGSAESDDLGNRLGELEDGLILAAADIDQGRLPMS